MKIRLLNILFGICLLSLSFICGCKVRVKDYDIPSVKEWTKEYKLYVFYSGMNAFTNDEIQTLLHKSKEGSLMMSQEILSEKYMIHADSVANDFIKSVKMFEENPEADLYGYRPYFASLLKFYESKKLDSLAKDAYKKYKNN